MKNVTAFIVLAAALGMLLFFACQKEHYCEGYSLNTLSGSFIRN